MGTSALLNRSCFAVRDLESIFRADMLNIVLKHKSPRSELVTLNVEGRQVAPLPHGLRQPLTDRRKDDGEDGCPEDRARKTARIHANATDTATISSRKVLSSRVRKPSLEAHRRAQIPVGARTDRRLEVKMGRAPRREETRCLCCWANEADVSGQKAVRDVVRDDTMKSLSAAAACGKARVPCHRLDPTRPQAPRMIVGFRVRLFDASLGGSWTTLFSRIAFLPSDDMRGPPSREGRVAACPVIELSGARLSQLSDRRNRPGVSPITRRKFSVRRLWLENPAARAISAIERSLSCRSPGSRPACVDRILKGTKPSELPSRPGQVRACRQQTAKTLRLDVPRTPIARRNLGRSGFVSDAISTRSPLLPKRCAVVVSAWLNSSNGSACC
jgi:hypothetical protein